MAFGTSSKIFTAFMESALGNANAFNLNTGGDTFKVALFNDSISTPDQTVSLANSAFGAGVWAANEVYDGSEWATGGQALDSVDITLATNVLKWDAADEVSAGTSATLADVRGCLVYDTTISNYGICFLSFGGANSVTDGTFTVVFNSSGIFTITM